MNDEFSFYRILEEYAVEASKPDSNVPLYIRLAAARHVKGIEDSKASPEYPFWFDEEEVERICCFAEEMPHAYGNWEVEKIVLQPWQVFFLGCLFGWKRRKGGENTHIRKFREAFVILPRGQGKSTIAAVIALYMLVADEEHGAQCFAGAPTEVQASEVYSPALIMASHPDLEEFRTQFGIVPMKKRIIVPSTNSFFTRLIGKPGEGQSPHCAIIDEYHNHQEDSQYLSMKTGMGKRQNPLLLVITTTGNDSSRPCYTKHQEAMQVLQGNVQEETLFALLFQAESTEDWKDFEVWKKVNPNYGVSVNADILYEHYQKAMTTPGQRNVILSRHLCIWPGAKSSWMDMLKWNVLAKPEMKMEDFRGQKALVSFDLAARVDLSSRIVLFTDSVGGDLSYYVFHVSYCPEARANDPRYSQYATWAEGGWIKTTPGEEIDLRQVEEDFLELAGEFVIQEVIFDQVNCAVGMMHNLMEEGFEVVKFIKRPINTTQPMREIEAAVASGRLHHQGDPALSWMIANVVKQPKKELDFPIEPRIDAKIDAADALIQAVARATELATMVLVDNRSVYETRGLRQL